MSISDILNPIDFDSTLLNGNTKNALFKPKQTIKTSNPIHTKTCQEKAQENIVFLDYDDTLLPTTYLLSNIEFEVNEKTKLIKTFSLNGKYNEIEIKEFISNLEKTGNATLKLLQQIFSKFKSSNIKIVTSGVKGWVPEALRVASTFCKVYGKISNLIQFHNIEILYARNKDIDQQYWKTKIFDQLLWNYLNTSNISNISKNKKINIVTIGDQWWDHTSIKQSFSYYVYGDCMCHHQIKLFPNPDCRYLAIELNYITDLLNETILFEFNQVVNDSNNKNQSQGLLLEFDGYNENDKNE